MLWSESENLWKVRASEHLVSQAIGSLIIEQLVALFWKIVERLEGRASLEELGQALNVHTSCPPVVS